MVGEFRWVYSSEMWHKDSPQFWSKFSWNYAVFWGASYPILLPSLSPSHKSDLHHNLNALLAFSGLPPSNFCLLQMFPLINLLYIESHLVPASRRTGGSDGKESACNAGDSGLVPGSRKSPGEGNSNPLQYFCLENSMDRKAWRATVHGVAKSQTQLSD